MRLMVISNTGGWRNFATTTSKQIKTPADVEARLKIRTIPAEIQQEMVRQLGGNPTAVAWPEVYTSLATGVVEGTKNGITDIMNMKFPEAGPQIYHPRRPRLYGRALVVLRRGLAGPAG